MPREQEDRTAAWIEAINHPMRRDILLRLWGLKEGSVVSPQELSSDLEVVLSAASYHVRFLCARGVIELAHTEQVRGSVKHFYRLRRCFRSEGWVIAFMRKASDSI